ncbi:MAG: YceI family protein [Gammaproteobacteria bacterium]|nr:YceI family protein [Gammaproteobacteria bacterium]MBU1480151.1 YceI family protein [Gammaproteobacteria bacterium]
MHKLPISLLAALFVLPACAADSYTIDPTHTWPMFEVNHLGYSTQRGRFDKTSGKITLDIATKKGSVDITIDANSLDMGFDKWNEHMKGRDFFQVAEYPTIRFTSDNLLFDGDKVVGAEGELTLHGVTQPLTLRVDNFKCAPHPMTRKMHCGADISATIERTQYGMSRFVPMVGDEVKLYSPIEADKD